MAQQGKQMRVGAREVFAYHSAKKKIVLYWLTVTGMRLVPVRCIEVVKPINHLK